MDVVAIVGVVFLVGGVVGFVLAVVFLGAVRVGDGGSE